ncbi:MAG: hypothetical protein WKF62_08040 [Solirubrobacterales bacterium]
MIGRTEEGGPSDGLRYAAIAAVLLVGGIHLQQYDSILKDVPTIGTLFILNAAGATGIALAIAGLRGRALALPALGGIALAGGAIVSVLIARYSSIFDYSEPTYRAAVVVSLAFEIAAVAILATLAARSARRETANVP